MYDTNDSAIFESIPCHFYLIAFTDLNNVFAECYLLLYLVITNRDGFPWVTKAL